jgi:hypothetical protein
MSRYLVSLTLSLALVIFFNIIFILVFELNAIIWISKNVTRMLCLVVNHAVCILELMVKYLVRGICKVTCLLIWIIKGIFMVVLTLCKWICKMFFRMKIYVLCVSILCIFIFILKVHHYPDMFLFLTF